MKDKAKAFSVHLRDQFLAEVAELYEEQGYPILEKVRSLVDEGEDQSAFELAVEAAAKLDLWVNLANYKFSVEAALDERLW